jgi:hypothetical protein
MEALHLHPVFAWNLVQDFLYSGLLTESSLHSDVKIRLSEGLRDGWINEGNRQAVRQMLVYSNGIILPPEVDTMAFTQALGTAIVQPSQVLPEAETRLWEPSREPQVYESQISVLTELLHHPGVSNHEIAATLDWWKRQLAFETKHKLNFSVTDQSPQAIRALLFNLLRGPLAEGRQDENPLWKKMDSALQQHFVAMSEEDPEKEASQFAQLNRIVSDVVTFSVYAERLARRGYPTFAAPMSGGSLSSPQYVKAERALVKLYFDNVQMAVPETATQAMKLRENNRIIHWREKIRAWERSLVTREIDARGVIDEINAASGYIAGARGLTLGLARVPLWFTFGAGALAKLAPALVVSTATGASIVSGALFALGGLKLVASAIESSVTGVAPLNHEWLMIGPPVHRKDTRPESC